MAFLRLMRPANIVTSIADVLAGIAIAGFFAEQEINQAKLFFVLLLCLSTAGLYGGGVVFNDVFDSELDAIERPERPIPSGLVTTRQAGTFGLFLFFIGITSAFLVAPLPGIIAICIALAAVIYDKWGKHHPFLGPLNMGLCRGLNLLLGISIQASALLPRCWLAFIPIIYIASITMISRGEVHGGNRVLLYAASFLFILVIADIFYFAWINHAISLTVLFLLIFAWMIFRPLVAAIRRPSGINIGRSVKAGVIALIVMDASLAASFGSVYPALIILFLLPFSIWLSRLFAVT
jgi:4-hydroxybenzoate polyprenyltransferase